MLPAHVQELLTAAIDGELSAAERRVVDKCLRDSEEARVFHSQLLGNAQRLRLLPRATPTDDLAASIMNMIDDRGIMPTPLPASRAKFWWDPQKLLPWVSICTAAGVLIVVSMASYMYIAVVEKQQQLVNQKKLDELASQPGALADKDLAKQGSTKKVEYRDPREGKTDTQGAEFDPLDFAPIPDTNVAKNDLPPVKPEVLSMMPRPVAGIESIQATPTERENDPFQVVKVRLSLLLPLKDLDQPYPKMQLRDELKKDEVVRLDLFCRDSSRATELLQAALRMRGQHVLVDGLAQDRLKKKMKSEYVFYTESLTADEIAQLLEFLGAEDKKAEAKKTGDGQFDKFLLAPVLPADLDQLAKLLGIPPAKFSLPKVKVNGPIDPRKTLESVTAHQLAQNLPKSASRGNEKVTLVLPYGATNHFPQNSKEIKSFLEKRSERKPGQVPMMLVLRTVN